MEETEVPVLMKKIAVYIFCILLMTVPAAGCTSPNQDHSSIKESTKERSRQKDFSQESEKDEEVVSTIAKIRTLPAGTVLDTADLKDGKAQECFYSEELTGDIIARIQDKSYQSNEQITFDDLRYLRVLHMGFDGQTHIGELIVNQCIAEQVLDVMRELYEQQYPIEKMVLIDEYDADDELSMSDNNTSAFNYRVIAGTNRLSKHGQGLAIDINPKYNPCVRTENGAMIVEPQNGAEYADRTQEFPYKITGDDVCCQIFKEYGFSWGGDWNSLKDYQHFEWEE